MNSFIGPLESPSSEEWHKWRVAQNSGIVQSEFLLEILLHEAHTSHTLTSMSPTIGLPYRLNSLNIQSVNESLYTPRNWSNPST